MGQKSADTKTYNAVKNRLALIQPVYVLAVYALIQISGASKQFSGISSAVSPLWYVQTALYAFIFGAVFYLATFSIKFYKGFILEHRFGLSNQSLSAWLKDEAKHIGLSLAFFIIFIEALYGFIRFSPDNWWLYLGLASILFNVIITKIAPVVLMPLFFKFERLSDDNLRGRLLTLANKCGIKILDVFRMDLSQKTKKANAALAGLGKTRRILLGDTLIDNYTTDEVEVVLAHELAHHKLRHMLKMTLFGSAGILAVLYLSNIMSLSTANAVGLNPLSDPASFPVIIFFITLFSAVLAPAENTFSRAMENAADIFAVKITGMSEAFISCMEKLALQNMADPQPSRFIEFMLYNHPPINKRIKYIKESFNEGV
jgi:STE24 endopeptidase